jgi:hypothetical protein
MSNPEIERRVRAILEELEVEERKVLARVISAERRKLHMGLPRGINDDIWEAVAEVIR